VVSSKVNLGIVSATLIDSAFNRIQRLKQRFVTNVEIAEAEIPTEFILYQNYPNPFNPSTKIRYSVPLDVKSASGGEMSIVSLKVYDVLGNKVAAIVNQEQAPGTYEVEFKSTSDNQQLASGIYFYRLQCGNFAVTKKMIILR
jgi:hypothetical protein